ncbi:MAG: hypothetical protein H6R42_555 [Nitrospirae bacterium]|jgi:hypothetical protein|nr:hypothetical protein [Nitrospirota bacterium]
MVAYVICVPWVRPFTIRQADYLEEIGIILYNIYVTAFGSNEK